MQLIHAVYASFVFLGGVSGAFAQTINFSNPPSTNIVNTCFYNNKSFSVGMIILQGDKFFHCTSDSSGAAWTSSDAKGAACLYADTFYSTGAIVSVSDQTDVECQANGEWKPRT